MTEPITWRSIGTPNFGNTANGMATANDMFRNAFDGIKGVIKEQEATDASNWNLGKEANTNAFLNKLMSYKTAEEAQAAQASGELGNMMSGFGAQIDGTAARTAQQSLVENLQRKEVQAQQHKEFSENVKQQDVVAGLQGALINAANPDEAKRVQQAIGIYRDSGMLNAPGSVKLLNEALARTNTIDDREWLGKERVFKTDANAREAAKHPLELNRIRASIDQSNEAAAASRFSREQEKQRTAIAAGRVAVDRIQAEAELTKNMTAASSELRKDNPYLNTVGNYRDKTPLSSAVAKEAGIDEDLANTLVASLKADPIKINGKTQDVPVHLLSAAATKFKDSWSLNVRDAGRTKDIREHLTKMMGSEAHAEKIAQSAVDMHNATKPAAQAAPGASAEFLKLENLGKPPKVQKDGLVFEDGKSVNFSYDPGVMASANLPSGAKKLSVTDGDTINITGASGKPVIIRLNGVDAQETAKFGAKGQAMADQHKQFLQDALTQGQVEIRYVANDVDKYGRRVAEVFVDGKNINDMMIKKGMATSLVVGHNPASKARREKLQLEAAKKGEGMFGTSAFTNTEPVTGGLYRSMEAFGK